MAENVSRRFRLRYLRVELNRLGQKFAGQGNIFSEPVPTLMKLISRHPCASDSNKMGATGLKPIAEHMWHSCQSVPANGRRRRGSESGLLHRQASLAGVNACDIRLQFGAPREILRRSSGSSRLRLRIGPGQHLSGARSAESDPHGKTEGGVDQP